MNIEDEEYYRKAAAANRVLIIILILNAALVWLILGDMVYRVGKANRSIQTIVSDLGW